MSAPKMRILVVDDEQNNRDLLKRYIERAGHQPSLAADGCEGLNHAIEEAPDLVLLDWMMPDLSGIDVLRALREHYDANELPVIMCTALDDADYVVAALSEGANDFVSKPVNPVILKARMTSLLERKASMVELARANSQLQGLLAERTRELAAVSGRAASSDGGGGELTDGDKVLIQKILQAVGENDQSMISASSPDALDLARRLQRAIGEHPAVAAGFKEVVV